LLYFSIKRIKVVEPAAVERLNYRILYESMTSTVHSKDVYFLAFCPHLLITGCGLRTSKQLPSDHC
jgi:hypothetical protein